jgi:DNA-binding response OmpR family regulator
MTNETKKKILIVEDDPLLIDIYTTRFKQVGFNLVVIKEGEKAVKAIEKEHPDLVLLDIVLPYMDGWDILRELKSKEDTKNIQVVVLSNLGQKEEIEQGLRLGAAKYLIKAHYTPSEIVEEIMKLI